jgi:hypothetical protein
MNDLRRRLLLLHDISKPIETRWDAAAANHLGRATLSAILHILFPDECGVWNNTSHDVLMRFGLWPERNHGTSDGQYYTKINQRLRTLAQHLGTDLWTLDELLWGSKAYALIILLDEEPNLTPACRERITEEFQRNQRHVSWLKRKYQNRCQLCGSIPVGDEFGVSDVSEAHHIKWLSNGGADSRENMMLLCPNHHAIIHAANPQFNWTRCHLNLAL